MNEWLFLNRDYNGDIRLQFSIVACFIKYTYQILS